MAKPFDDELVVDDLVIDVKGRPEEIECALEAFDRHVDPGAKASGIRQDDLHREAASGSRWRKTPISYAFGGRAKRRDGAWHVAPRYAAVLETRRQSLLHSVSNAQSGRLPDTEAWSR